MKTTVECENFQNNGIIGSNFSANVNTIRRKGEALNYKINFFKTN